MEKNVRRDSLSAKKFSIYLTSGFSGICLGLFVITAYDVSQKTFQRNKVFLWKFEFIKFLDFTREHVNRVVKNEFNVSRELFWRKSCFWENLWIVIVFGFLPNNFLLVCQNCVLHMQRNFLSETIYLESPWRSYKLRKMPKNFFRCVRSPIYLPRESIREKCF